MMCLGIMAWKCLIRQLTGEVGGVSDFLSFHFELRSAEEILRTSSVPADELVIFTLGWSKPVVTSCFVAKSSLVILDFPEVWRCLKLVALVPMP